MSTRPLAKFSIALVLLAALPACGGSPEERSPTATASATPQISGETDAETLQAGEQLYADNCQTCHGDREGEGRTGAAPPHNETGHTWHHPDAQLKDWILNGKPLGAMPAFGDTLTEEEVDAILAYIQSWWTQEQRESQADVSRRYQEALERQQQGSP